MEKEFSFYLDWKNLNNLMRRKCADCAGDMELGGLTAMQIFFLDFLYRNQNQQIFQRDLESEFQIRRSTVTGILQGMEKKGLVLRMSVEEDARLKRIVLTEQAMQLHQAVTSALHQAEEEALEGLSKEERDCLIRLLEKIRNNLSKCQADT